MNAFVRRVSGSIVGEFGGERVREWREWNGGRDRSGWRES